MLFSLQRESKTAIILSSKTSFVVLFWQNLDCRDLLPVLNIRFGQIRTGSPTIHPSIHPSIHLSIHPPTGHWTCAEILFRIHKCTCKWKYELDLYGSYKQNFQNLKLDWIHLDWWNCNSILCLLPQFKFRNWKRHSQFSSEWHTTLWIVVNTRMHVSIFSFSLFLWKDWSHLNSIQFKLISYRIEEKCSSTLISFFCSVS